MLTALAAYLRTRRITRPGVTRAAFEAWQRRALTRWLRRAPRRVAFYADRPADLATFPVIDKATVMSRFADFNRPRIDAAAAWRAFAGDRRIGRYTVGASSGTSGNRGLFVIDEHERFTWLGVMLAKALPGFWRRQTRVAVILPLHTPLYDSARHSRRLMLRFFDLTAGVEAWQAELEAFAPDVLIAPPKVLRHLAGQGTSLRPNKVFSAAETLDPVDRDAIEARFGAPLHEIYMATEGLLAVSCERGRLHLAEDAVYFEFEPVPGSDAVSPLITQFRRSTQIMARYRMNDLLRLDDSPCPCGSPLKVVREVIGRMDDAFVLPGPHGEVLLTPDVLRNAVLDADRRIADFRLRQTGAAQLDLLLATDLPDEAMNAAGIALRDLLIRCGIDATLQVERGALATENGRKLRRVERQWRG